MKVVQITQIELTRCDN